MTGKVNQQLTDVPVATFLDPNANDTFGDFSASVAWGDGTTSLGIISPGSNGIYTITSTKPSEYSAAGTYTVTVVVTRQSNSQTANTSGQAVITATVATPIIVANNTTFPVTPGRPFTATVATFTDTNQVAVTELPTALINWGDGQTSTVTATYASGNNFSVTGTHTYSSSGTASSYPVNVTIIDPSGQTFTGDSSTATLLVSAPDSGLIGGLATTIGNGPHAADGFTNTNRPTFIGTAAPYSIVQLYARHFNTDAEQPLGEAVTNASGQWTLTTGPLAVGTYIVTGTVTIPGGYPSGLVPMTNQSGGNLLYIDLTPKLVRWLSHGHKSVPHTSTSASHPRVAKLQAITHHKA